MALRAKDRHEVHVWRRSSPSIGEGPERIRWAYAAFVPGEEALEKCMAILAENGARAGTRQRLNDLEATVLLIGPDQVRESGHQDPGLRRAIREARQAIRGGDAATTRRMKRETPK